MAVAPDAVRLVETDDDVAALDDVDGPVALLAQTTLSHHDWAGVLAATRERFPDLWMPGPQRPLLRHHQPPVGPEGHRPRADAVVVIGSANSSNTLALEKVARAAGCARVYRVNAADELPDDLTGTVGVTAGASAPEELVEAGHRPAGAGRRRRGGRRHRRGRVLPAAPRAARAPAPRRPGQRPLGGRQRPTGWPPWP